MTEHDVDVLDFPGADRLRAAGDVAPPSSATVSAALTAVRAAAAPAPVRVRPLHRRRRILVSAAAVAAVAAGVAVYPAIGIGGSRPAAEASAAEFLHEMADTAAAKPDSSAPYWKVETRTSASSSPSGRVYPTTTRTEWLGRNKWFQVTAGNDAVGEFTGPANGWALTPDGHWLSTPGHHVAQPGRTEQTSWYVGSSPVPEKTVTWDELKTLPTEPKALRAKLLGDATGPQAELGLFNGIDALLADAPAGPQLRAALYEVLAGIPDVHLVGRAEDSTGRTGTAVELKAGAGSSRVIVDPKTSQLLETVTVTATEGVTGRTRTTYLSAGPADEAPRTTH